MERRNIVVEEVDLQEFNLSHDSESTSSQVTSETAFKRVKTSALTYVRLNYLRIISILVLIILLLLFIISILSVTLNQSLNHKAASEEGKVGEATRHPETGQEKNQDSENQLPISSVRNNGSIGSKNGTGRENSAITSAPPTRYEDNYISPVTISSGRTIPAVGPAAENAQPPERWKRPDKTPPSVIASTAQTSHSRSVSVESTGSSSPSGILQEADRSNDREVSSQILQNDTDALRNLPCRKINCKKFSDPCVVEIVSYMTLKRYSCCECLPADYKLIRIECYPLQIICHLVVKVPQEVKDYSTYDLAAYPKLRNLDGNWDLLADSDDAYYLVYRDVRPSDDDTSGFQAIE